MSIKNANPFSQISWGFNPKGRVADCLTPPWNKNKMSILTRLAGVMYPGFGATPFHQGGETISTQPLAYTSILHHREVSFNLYQLCILTVLFNWKKTDEVTKWMEKK